MHLRIVAFSLLIFSNLLLYSQDKIQSYSLSQAVETALKNNLTLQNSEIDLNKAKKKIYETTTIGLPHINASVDYQNFLDLPTSLIPGEFFPGGKKGEFMELKFGTTNNLNAKITATQLLFDGSYIVGLQAAKVYLELAKKQVKFSEIDVKTNVTKAYYSVVVTEENARLLKKNLDNLKRILFETSQLQINGFVEEIDVDRLTLSSANLETQYQHVIKQIDLMYNFLKFQMGIDLNKPILLTDSISILLNNFTEKQIPEININNRIEYQLVTIQSELAELNIKRYKAGYLPSIGSFISYSKSAQRDAFNFFDSSQRWFPTSVIGVQISIPIFDSFYKSSVIQQARLDNAKVKNQQKLMEQSISLEMQKTITGYNHAIQQYKNQTKNMELAEKIYQTTLVKYKEGVGSGLEVTSAETTYFQTRTLYINALYELIIAKVDLEKAVGM